VFAVWPDSVVSIKDLANGVVVVGPEVLLLKGTDGQDERPFLYVGQILVCGLILLILRVDGVGEANDCRVQDAFGVGLGLLLQVSFPFGAFADGVAGYSGLNAKLVLKVVHYEVWGRESEVYAEPQFFAAGENVELPEP